MKTKEYFKETGKNFINSFTNINSSLLFVVVYDFVFYIFLMISYSKYTSILQVAMEPILEIGARDFGPDATELAVSASSAINHVYFNIFLYGVIFLVSAILIYAVTNFLIWSAITSTKIQKSNKNFALKFLGLNYIWCVVWILLSLILIWSVRTEVIKYWVIFPQCFGYLISTKEK